MGGWCFLLAGWPGWPLLLQFTSSGLLTARRALCFFGKSLRFEFNGYANPSYRPGPFTLRIEGGIRGFRAPRPQLVMVSSGAARRAALGMPAHAALRPARLLLVCLAAG